MIRRFTWFFLAVLFAALSAPPLWAQMGTIRGVAKDVDGKPMPDAMVQLVDKNTGAKLEVKVNEKGEFFSMARPALYHASLLKDGKEIFYLDPIRVTYDQETYVDFDLSKQKAAIEAAESEEQRKAREAIEKENTKIRNLNQLLAQAADLERAGNLDQAVAVLTQATQSDPSRDLLWYKLAEAERLAAAKASPEDRTATYQKAAEHYRKAIDLKTASGKTSGSGAQMLGAYYNNLGDALGRSGDSEGAIAAFDKAAQINPASAGTYYFNLGAILTNSGQVDAAIEAFDKAIATDPKRADAYYWKGVNLIGKATLKGNKMEAPSGTAEAFNKYLELQPTGPYAQASKDMLASIGSEVETSFGKGKGAKKK
jgi:tetratricopeptide (TPR) repeat protein